MSGDRPPSPLSFAFNFHNQRRRASLQHVFVGPGQQQEYDDHHVQIQDHRSIDQNNDKQALVMKLKQMKEKTLGVNRNINAMRTPNSMFQEEQGTTTTNSSSTTILQQRKNPSRQHLVVSKLLPATGSIRVNNVMHGANQNHLQKLNKAKEDLQSKYHKNYPTRQEEAAGGHDVVGNDARINEIIPGGNLMLPRSYDEIKNDLIHLHRRHSIAASVSTTNIVSGLITNQEQHHNYQVNEMEKSRRKYKNHRRRHTKNYHKKRVKEQSMHSRYDNKSFEYESLSELNEEEDSDTSSSSTKSGGDHHSDKNSDDTDDDNNSDHALCFKTISKPLYDQTTQEMSSTIMNQNQQQQYTKDYIKLAQEHKKMSCYLHGNPKLKRKCIVCKRKVQTTLAPSIIVKRTGKRGSPLKYKQKSKQQEPVLFLSKVLFPCQHRCICNECWESQTFTKCPFCNEEIKIAIDYSEGTNSSEEDGGISKEEEQYWDWINEIKPHLPNGFIKSFTRNSRRAISEAMAKSIMDDGDDDDDDKVNTHVGGDELDKDEKNRATKNDCRVNEDDPSSAASSLISLSKAGNDNPSHFHNREVVDSKVCIIS